MDIEELIPQLVFWCK